MVSYIDLDDGSNIALQGATLDQLSGTTSASPERVEFNE
jgi:hypothetical protein